MAFPRSFKSETWFVRLVSGEVVVSDATVLERAFHCGLIDSRTPVMAVGTSVWTRFGDAAELSPEDLQEAAQGIDTAGDEPAADLANGAPWHVRNYDEERRLRPMRHRSVMGVLAMAAAIGLATLGLGVARAEAGGDAIAARFGAMQLEAVIDPQLARALRNAKELPEVPHHSDRDRERISKEQQRRFREIDLGRRMRGDDKRDIRGMVNGKAKVIPYSSVAPDPFAPGGNPFDPLNGAL